MRAWCLAALFLLAACEGETSNHPTRDMAVQQMPMMDMAVPGPLRCSAVLDCYDACRTDSCFDDCYARDTPKAKMLDDDLFYGCPVRLCNQPDDGGVAPCTSEDVAAVMADPQAHTSLECQACTDTIEPYMSCPTELAACNADK
jgi:hypothetical protein